MTEPPFVPRERLLEKQRYFQHVHKYTYVKGPMDKITSIAIPIALAASSVYLIVRHVWLWIFSSNLDNQKWMQILCLFVMWLLCLLSRVRGSIIWLTGLERSNELLNLLDNGFYKVGPKISKNGLELVCWSALFCTTSQYLVGDKCDNHCKTRTSLLMVCFVVCLVLYVEFLRIFPLNCLRKVILPIIMLCKACMYCKLSHSSKCARAACSYQQLFCSILYEPLNSRIRAKETNGRRFLLIQTTFAW